MRLKVFSLCATFAILSVTAQQSLNERPKVVSPQIFEDSVVFNLYAPLAQEVYVTGDLSDAPIAMEKSENGVWSTTLKNLAPEIYIYQFDIDGIKTADPSNAFIVRDIATNFSLLFPAGLNNSDYSVNDVPHGTVSHAWYPTKLGSQRRLSIYTPPGYESSGQKYPVLYLLHGMGGDEEAWLSLGRASQILDNLIASNGIEPMIVVMPNGNIALQSAPEPSYPGMAQPTTQLQHTMDGTFEYSFPEIVNYVDSLYRTIDDRSSRAVAGLSMGGFHSLNISALYPELFGYVGLFSPAINPRVATSDPLFAHREDLLKKQFSNPDLVYWIGIGKDDFLFDENVEFRNFLNSKNYPYTYFETEGGHTWKNWRNYLREFTPLLFRK